MKKATTKKAAAKKVPATPSTTPAPATITGRAKRNFRSAQGFHAIGSTVTLTGDDVARRGHFLEL